MFLHIIVLLGIIGVFMELVLVQHATFVIAIELIFKLSSDHYFLAMERYDTVYHCFT